MSLFLAKKMTYLNLYSSKIKKAKILNEVTYNIQLLLIFTNKVSEDIIHISCQYVVNIVNPSKIQ